MPLIVFRVKEFTQIPFESQCVRCTDFTPKVGKKILEAAGRGVRFQMVFNKHSPAAEEFRTLFDPIEGAELIEASDSAISMQGLSDREVVIAFPGVECIIRAMPIADSGPCRSLIPAHADH